MQGKRYVIPTVLALAVRDRRGLAALLEVAVECAGEAATAAAPFLKKGAHYLDLCTITGKMSDEDRAPIEAAAISVDVIVQNVSHQNITDISFTVARTDLARTLRIVEPLAREMHAQEVTSSATMAKVSIVGSGMVANPGYAARMFGALADSGCNIISITTSEIRIQGRFSRSVTLRSSS